MSLTAGVPGSRGRLGSAAFLVLAAVGCAPREERAPGPAATVNPAPASIPVAAVGLATDRARYELAPGRDGPEARIAVTFRAPPDTTAWILHCNRQVAWGLQRRVGGSWRDGWLAVTNECLSPAIVVAGDMAFVDTLVFTPSAGTVVDPGAIGPGTYRVVLYNVLTSFDVEKRPFGPDLPLERRVSAPITLVDDETP